MTVERRRHIRVVVPGAYCELLVNGAMIGVVSLEDVSDSGVFVAFPRPIVPVHTAVELRFIEESEPLVVSGVIVQVVQPGGPRTPGYGIELQNPPADTVERVVLGARSQTPPPSPSTSSLSSPPSFPRLTAPPSSIAAPTPMPVSPWGAAPPPAPASSATLFAPPPSSSAQPSGSHVAVILGTNTGPGASMAQALSLFGVDAVFFSDPRGALKSIDKGTRIALIELMLLDATSVTISQVRSAAPRARLIVTVDALPPVDRRAQLLKQGADELLLAPFEIFAVLGKMHAAAVRARPR